MIDTAAMATQLGSERLRRTQTQRRTEAQQRLIDAAAELICEVGPSRLTLANVGERAGFSRGLATHHFGSKAALMQRLVAEVTQQFHAALPHNTRPTSVFGQIAEFMDFFFAVLDDPLPINRARLVLWADAISTPSEDIRPTMLAADQEFRAAIEAPLRRALDAGEIAQDTDPAALAGVVMAMLRGVAVAALFDDAVDLGAARREIESLLRGRLTRKEQP